MTTFDYTPLSRTITNNELAEFRNNPEYSAVLSYGRKMRWWIIMLFSFSGGFWLAAMLGFLQLENAVVRSIAILAMVAVGGGVGYWITRMFISFMEKKRLRLLQFAQANTLRYESEVTSFNHTGLVFDEGEERLISDRFLDGDGVTYEIGNFQYVTGSGRNRAVMKWGYICIFLERNVPHMVLDATKNDQNLLGIKISNLPKGFNRDQTLSLEGDFNNHFTLYAPKEYERDALYIFTPDLMAKLIDETAHYDVETVDNRLYIYAPMPFNFTDSKTYEKIFSIIDVIGAKAITRTDRYVDERREVPADYEVATQGKRLKQGLAPGAIIFGAIFVLLVVWELSPLIIALLAS